MRMCSECNVGRMEHHNELYFWKKCPICGFCEIPITEMTQRDIDTSHQNPYAKYPAVEAVEEVKRQQDQRKKS